MKTLRNLLGINFTLLILLSVFFTLLIWGIGRIFPSAADGFPLYKNGQLIGYRNIGQKFTQDKYFWSRPSACDYNAAAGTASNLGPTNPDYLKAVAARIDTILAHNPGISKSDIPVDMITTSGSGLDPNISVQSALFQVPRISKIRGIPADKLIKLIQENTEKPLFGFLGPEKINVLELNLKLEEVL
jgi:K+-transporting ATPase ATPase C chain